MGLLISLDEHPHLFERKFGFVSARVLPSRRSSPPSRDVFLDAPDAFKNVEEVLPVVLHSGMASLSTVS
jgi:hypothetical protein